MAMTPEAELELLRHENAALISELEEIKSRAQAPIPAGLAAAVTVSRDLVARKPTDPGMQAAVALADAVVKLYGFIGILKMEADDWRRQFERSEEQRNTRDTWLVEKGLWLEFVASLPSRNQK